MPKKPKKAKASSTHVGFEPHDGNSQASQGEVIDTVATLKDLRKVTHHTQDDLADAMGVGQGTISRIEKRDDMLLSTLQHYVESVGGTLQILVTFPNRPPLVVERLGKKLATSSMDTKKKLAGPARQAPT